MIKKYCRYCGRIIKAKNVYCNNVCSAAHRHKLTQDKHAEKIALWKAGKLPNSEFLGYGVPKWLRRYLLSKFNNACVVCGWHEVNAFSGKIPLEVEHIDGNYKNNAEENLTILCPNCHSLTSTYKGANRGRGRAYRKRYALP